LLWDLKVTDKQRTKGSKTTIAKGSLTKAGAVADPRGWKADVWVWRFGLAAEDQAAQTLI